MQCSSSLLSEEEMVIQQSR